MKLLFVTLSTVAMSIAAAAPPTDKKPVTDEYHGVKVVEDYRWLEESGSPAVKAWSQAQNDYSRAWLDSRPDRASIEAKLTALYAKDTPSHSGLVSRPGRLFALKFQPPKQQRLLVTLASADDLAAERLVLDPNEIEPKGHVAMDWFVPSPDGKLIAVCLSENGSEEGTLHFYRAENGEPLPDQIARVQYPTGGGSAAWTADGSAVFYTRYPHQGERTEADLNFFQQIYFHKLGTPASADEYSAGRDFPRIAETYLSTTKDGRWLLATVANGDGGEFAHYVRETREGASWRQITRFEDGIKGVVFGHDDATLFLRSVKDAPRGKVLRLSLNAEFARRRGDRAGERGRHRGDHAHLDSPLRRRSPRRTIADSSVRPPRKEGREVPLPPASGVGQMVGVDDRILFRETSFIAPAAWMLYDPADGSVRKTALFNTSPVDLGDIEAVREFAVSKDGTKVPVSILCRQGTKLDGTNPHSSPATAATA